MTDTIFALASGRGRAGIAVIRVSGPAARAAVARLTRRDPPKARLAALRRLYDPATGEELDRGIVVWYAAPASFTGEDVAELHVHAGPAVVAGVTDALVELGGFRPAEPGEFTRRAFLNGKLDLTAAEGVVDLVAAETAAQRRQALRQMDGVLGRVYEGWRGRLVRALAHVEASIDFAEEDLPEGIGAAARDELAALAAEMRAHLADGHRGERLREGVSIAIVGPPNAGKSTLLNRLAARDAAIVSPIAGTTRDVIDIDLDLDGFPVRIADTAGLRQSDDVVESEGVRRAVRRAADADVKLIVLDATSWPEVDLATRAAVDERAILIVNKTDLRGVAGPMLEGRPVLPLSLASGYGFEAVRQALVGRVRGLVDTGSVAALTRPRHRAAVESCAAALERAVGAGPVELVAEDLRLGARALGRITGRVGVEDMLDVIFREFCIGK